MVRIRIPPVFLALAGVAIASLTASAEIVSLSTLDVSKIKQPRAAPRANLSAGNRPISIGGHKFSQGLGVHAQSVFMIDLKSAAQRFTASVGVDDEMNKKNRTVPSTVQFHVLGDGRILWSGEVMKAGDAPVQVDVDVHDIAIMELLVTDGGDGNDGDHADWGDAQLEMGGDAHPEAVAMPEFEAAEAGIPSTPAAPAGHTTIVPVASLNLSKIVQGHLKPMVNKSVRGRPLAIAGKKFSQGLGTHAESIFAIDLKRGGTRFTAFVGVDDDVQSGHGSVDFEVLGDGQLLWSSDIMKGGDPAKQVDVSLTGVSILTLLVTDSGDGDTDDHADWADAKIEMATGMPVPADFSKP